MRSNLFLLAGLASSALALPTTASTELDARHFGLVSGLIETVKDILHGTSPVHILGGISAEAAAALGGGALGCTAGSVDLEYRKKLAVWIKTGAGAHLEASVKTALLAWCEADVSVDSGLDVDIRAQLGFFIPGCASIAAEADLYVSLDGVFSLAGEVLGVLSATAQATLEAAIGALVDLDWKVQAGLEFCAAGGLVGDLDVEILNALKVWLNSSECTLSVSLKHTLQIWISGKIGGGVIQIPSLPVAGVATIGVGKSLEALIEASGALVVSAQTSLSAFLKTDVGVAIDADISAILALIAKGSLAIDISLDKRISLSLWLGSSDCKLTAELKGLLALWLSFGVSTGAEVSLDVSHNIITDLTGFLTGTVDALIGTHIQGLLSFILSGKGVLSISLEARAQLAALVSGSIDIDISADIQLIIIGWLSGCQKCCGGEIISTHTPSLPSSTPSVPKPTETPAVPTDVQPTGTPSVPSQTPGFPGGEQPSGTPSVPAQTPGTPTDVSPTETPSETTTPCDTLTSEIVGSSTISIPGSETPGVPTDVQPTGTPSVPVTVPAGPSETPVGPGETPVGPGETSTPCDTLTSEIVGSSTISIPGETTPAVPTDVQPTETPSVPAGPSETPVGPGETPVGPGETSTPCDTLTSEIVSSSTISVPGETPAVPTD
ncbi:putative cell wall protein, partial [Aspergillus stella-maris]|uniref:putative cell wall protein n=1 Tax=Aspergillus stella-maris TaxID=1810926 RepID=UPI003CCD12DF